MMIVLWQQAVAQTRAIDSLQTVLHQADTEEKRIDVLNKLAGLYTRLSLEKAEQLANEALSSATSLQYQKGIASGYNNLGVCHAIQGKYTIALDYFFKALRIREEETKETVEASKTLNNIAGIFLFQKEYDKAIEYSERSLKNLQKANDQSGVGTALVSLGMVYAQKLDTTQALRYFRQSAALFKKLGIKNKEGQVWVKISVLYESHQQRERALEACFKAMNLINIKSDHYLAAELFQTIGQIYASSGNNKSAEHYFHRALNLSDAFHDNEGSLNARLKLSNFFQQRNQYDSALFYYKAYSELHSKTFDIEKSSQIGALEKIYDTEKKDQQLRLDRQEIKIQRTIIAAISVLLAIIVISIILLYRYSREKKRSNKELKLLNRSISEKNEEIMAQSEELIVANEAIKSINDDLEREVNHRTEKIKEQNEKLIEYAYFNAHKVRGPLARILGLVMLAELETSPEGLRDLQEKINFSAKELDDVIMEINQKLENE